jgi:hypothetical protein
LETLLIIFLSQSHNIRMTFMMLVPRTVQFFNTS